MPGIHEDTLVALDLETTGVNSSNDHIIEVGAVKFVGDKQVDTLSTLVNPNRKLSSFIVGLTGINQEDVDAAPQWDDVKDEVADFIAGVPIIGHNIGFDASFLRSHGVKPDGLYDTMSMAEIALPYGPEYSLVRLSQRFGFSHDDPHRALSDALVTRDLFLHLLEIIEGFDRSVLEQIEALGEKASTPLGRLAGRILESDDSPLLPTSDSITGIDHKELGQRLRSTNRTPSVEPHKYDRDEIDGESVMDSVKSIFGSAGALEETLDGYESRPEQLEMAEAVTNAIENGEHLVVEAGTGVGKSLAYLIPSVLYAIRQGKKVVVSTNTINLQEQLTGKDIGISSNALEAYGDKSDRLRAAQLKGRANYVCFKRWQNAVLSSDPNDVESKILSKLLVWLQETETGDRGELALGRLTPMFSRYSAQGALMCPSNEGPCFLRTARNKANVSNVVVINHALLMSDIAMGGGLLPDHDVLVIDEAHHLESAATNHLGFSVNQFQLENELRQLTGNRGILGRLAAVISKGEINALDANSKTFFNFSEIDMNRILTMINNSKKDNITKINNLSNSYKIQKNALDKMKLVSKITPNDDEIRPLMKEIEKITSQRTRLEEQHDQIDTKNYQNKALIKSLNYKIRHCMNLKRESEKMSSSEKMGSVVMTVLDEYADSLRKTKISELESNILQGLDLLLHKDDFVEKVTVNPENFDVKLWNRNNDEITKDMLSKGELQIYATALVWALAKTSGRSLPFMIDTPLARLDVEHRENIVGSFFPQTSQQTIILSTDSEITSEYYEILHPAISKSYVMEFDDSKGKTQIRPGYFFEKQGDLVVEVQ